MPVTADDPRIARSGFAVLQGEGIEYYVKKYEVVMGRTSKSTNLDIVLGDNMNISRQHATITYNFDIQAFELKVLGKNGVSVNNELYTPSSPPLELKSQDFLQVGDKAFYFLLPRDAGRNMKRKQRSQSLTNVTTEDGEGEGEGASHENENGVQEYDEESDDIES